MRATCSTVPSLFMAAPTAHPTRNLILTTAREHLRRFGEDKMTIVDVARALGMSHANVYRFFKNKTEILDAIVDDWLARVEALIDPILHETGWARERIEKVVLELYRRRKSKLQEDGEVYESFRRIIQSRPAAVATRVRRIVEVFEQLIREGSANGEFRALDPEEAAQTLRDATAIFLHPLMTSSLLSETTEPRLRNVVRYFLQAIS
jgi:AcrR family transcriptional regulator